MAKSGAVRLGSIFFLAWRDLMDGWRATLCLSLGAAVALAPLLLLYGLNFGFVTGLLDQLRQDPRMRELRPVGQYELSADWFKTQAENPQIGFLLPRTRYLASSAIARGEDGSAEVEMLPSAPGDPMLRAVEALDRCGQIVLTESVATRLGVAAGDSMDLQIIRFVGEKRESHRETLAVLGVIDRGLMERDAVFVPTDYVVAVEDWRENADQPTLLCQDGAAAARQTTFASFRMFANDVRDVPALRALMIAEQIDVRTRAEEISTTLAIEQGLGVVFIIVTLLASAGFLLTLGLHLAAAVVEKERDLAILRLLGLSRFEVSLMPLVQGAVIAAGGALAAGFAVKLAQPAINRQLEGIASFEGDVSQLLWSHVAIALLASVIAGALAGVLAGRQAARIQISKGLRRD